MLHILVVEDGDDTAATCAQLLRLYGHDVAVVADGPSALHVIQADPPDVVLLDLAMSKMDGWNLARQIRRLSLGKRPLLIAVSGHGMKSDRKRLYKCGIDIHLVKPVNPARLEHLLTRFRRIVPS
jgi:CheY-like chemotaxis protein